MYRDVWTLYSELLTRLLRVTANDLRFWLVDNPYCAPADRMAVEEVARVEQFLLASTWSEGRFLVLIETPQGLQRFWSAVKESGAG